MFDVISANDVNTPAEVIDAIAVAPYLNTSLPPDSTIEKLAVTRLVAFVAVPPILSPEAVPVMFVPTRADGVPNAGVTKVGLVANTKAPEPVSLVTAAAKLDDEGVAKKVATPVPKPEIPVATGSPVAFVNVPEAGVPKAGVTNVGLLNVPAVTEAPVNTAVPVTVGEDIVGEDIVGELNVGEIM